MSFSSWMSGPSGAGIWPSGRIGVATIAGTQKATMIHEEGRTARPPRVFADIANVSILDDAGAALNLLRACSTPNARSAPRAH